MMYHFLNKFKNALLFFIYVHQLIVTFNVDGMAVKQLVPVRCYVLDHVDGHTQMYCYFKC